MIGGGGASSEKGYFSPEGTSRHWGRAGKGSQLSELKGPPVSSCTERMALKAIRLLPSDATWRQFGR